MRPITPGVDFKGVLVLLNRRFPCALLSQRVRFVAQIQSFNTLKPGCKLCVSAQPWIGLQRQAVVADRKLRFAGGVRCVCFA